MQIEDKETLNEIINVLRSDPIKDENYISLSDVLALRREYYKKEERIKQVYSDIINYKLEKKFPEYHIAIRDFDINQNKLIVSLIMQIPFNDRKIYFSKMDGRLYIPKREYVYAIDILSKVSNDFYKLYDELEKIKIEIGAFNSLNNTSNSKFKIYYFDDSICITMNNFCVRGFLNNELYNCDTNSSEIFKLVSGTESDLFKNVYICFDYLPSSLRNELYKIRHEQLKKEKNQNIEKKLQKRFKKTILTFD